jgi:hypothetical protein
MEVAVPDDTATDLLAESVGEELGEVVLALDELLEALSS